MHGIRMKTEVKTNSQFHLEEALKSLLFLSIHLSVYTYIQCYISF